jgi:branched-chain amino acid transport system ATP-binding protein
MESIIELTELHKSFGGIVVADNINLSLSAGEIVGLIGPNGAGKTSLFNLITGLVKLDSGSISINGKPVNGVPMHGRARLGLSRTWQNVRLFPSLSVLDNLLVAPRFYAGESIIKTIFAPGSLTRERKRLEERAYAQLEKIHMVDAAQRNPMEFSHGKQKLISLARALMNDGNCLLLDEPMAGVEGPAHDAIVEVVKNEATAGRAICVVEHNIAFVRDLCDRAVFMFNGQIISTGSVEELMQNEELTELYFGT